MPRNDLRVEMMISSSESCFDPHHADDNNFVFDVLLFCSNCPSVEKPIIEAKHGPWSSRNFSLASAAIRRYQTKLFFRQLCKSIYAIANSFTPISSNPICIFIAGTARDPNLSQKKRKPMGCVSVNLPLVKLARSFRIPIVVQIWRIHFSFVPSVSDRELTIHFSLYGIRLFCYSCPLSLISKHPRIEPDEQKIGQCSLTLCKRNCFESNLMICFRTKQLTLWNAEVVG